MTGFTEIIELKANLPEDCWPWLIPALRRDELVWSALQDTKVRNRAISQLRNRPNQWSPATIALVALEYPEPTQTTNLNAQIRQKALQTFQVFTHQENAELSIPQNVGYAGLLAIALNENQRLAGSWKEFPSQLQPSNLKVWRTPVACLFGFVDNPQEFLEALLFSDSAQINLDLALHAIFCNPLSIAEQLQLLRSTLINHSLDKSLPLLKKLSELKPFLARRLANTLMENQSFGLKSSSVTPQMEPGEKISDLINYAEVYSLASQDAQAACLQNLALEQAKKLVTSISAQIVTSLSQKGNLDEAKNFWERYAALVEPAASPPTSLILSLIDANRLEEASSLFPAVETLPPTPRDPAYYLVMAYQYAIKGDLAKARTETKQAIKAINDQTEFANRDQGEADTREVQTSLEVLQAIGTLSLELDMPRQAIEVFQWVLNKEPNDPNLNACLAETFQNSGELNQALKYAHLAVALSPDRADLRRQLAEILEASGDWKTAYDERTKLVDERFRPEPHLDWPTPSDVRALAICAIQSGQPQRAIDQSSELLQINPEDGLTYAVTGEALANMGKLDEALAYFRQAIQLAPEQTYPWLSQARVYQSAGQHNKVIETLRSAAHAIPNDPIVHLNLAEAYLAENSHSPALNSLRQAYELAKPQERSLQFKTIQGVPKRRARIISGEVYVRIALLLGNSLSQMGHWSEASAILESVFETHPNYPGLAYAYGSTLLALDMPEAAIAPLSIVVKSEPKDPEPYLEYAQALLKTNTQPEEAIQAVRSALELSPKNQIAMALLAEALAANGDLECAQQAYYRALETNITKEPKWQGRLAFGLGKVALSRNQSETAIAALQEATRAEPHNPHIQRTLAEAYLVANLTKEALYSARAAVQLAPNDLEILTWFAEHALKLGAIEEAHSALDRTLELNPREKSLFIRIGRIYHELGKTTTAKKVYKRILEHNDATIADFQQAAQALIQLSDPLSAIACLENALKSGKETSSSLLLELARAYYEAGMPDHSIETMERATKLYPNELNLHLSKADLLALLNRFEDAQMGLDAILPFFRHCPELHQKIAFILRASGKVIQACEHAEQMVIPEENKEVTPASLCMRNQAAEVMAAMLKFDHSARLLGELLPLKSEDHEAETSTSLPYYCLSSELALDRGEEVLAADALNRAYRVAPEHVRVLALQSRLANRQNDKETAIHRFETALKQVKQIDMSLSIPQTGKDDNSSVEKVEEEKNSQIYDQYQIPWLQKSIYLPHAQATNLLALSKAAIELQYWDIALNLIHQAINLTPLEPLPHYEQACALVQRAEHQRLCQALEVITHAPGHSALSEHAYHNFNEAIQITTHLIGNDKQSLSQEAIDHLERWRSRGEAVFNPGIPPTRDVAPKSLQELIQAAQLLGITENSIPDIEHAIIATNAALEQQPSQPLYHILLGCLYRTLGDNNTANQHIQNGLSIWQDEPRWQHLAAQIQLREGNPQEAISHLQKAISYEPDKGDHYLALGNTYLELGDHNNAIRNFEIAQSKAPDNVDANLALARAHLANNDPKTADSFAQRANHIAPDNPNTILLQAEIALQSYDAPKTEALTKSVLGTDPLNIQALLLNARALDNMNRVNEALTILDHAITNVPDPLPILLERVDLLNKSQGSVVAFKTLQELANKYQDNPAIQAKFAFTMSSYGNRDEAIQAAQRALQNGGIQLTRCEQAKLHSLLGALFRQTGQLDQAIFHLSEAINNLPTEIDPYLELGSTHLERRLPDLAFQAYQQAIKMAENDPRPYYQYGLALKESRDYLGAEKMLRKAAELAPKDLNIHRQLGAMVALNLVHNRRSIRVNV